MKKCTKCGKEKPLDNFHKDKASKDGHRGQCKECRNSGKPRKPPKILDTKTCQKCGEIFAPTSNRQTWCKTCSPIERRKNRMQSCKEYYHKHKELKGCHPTGTDSHSYKTGIGLYKKTRKELCERCGSSEHLVVHHKDQDRHNNSDDNLETLCRKCHFKEHHIKDNQGRFYKSN